METPRDEQLAADLKALRPTPRPEFTAELDQRAAAGFPRRSHGRWTPFARLRTVQPRRLLIPAGGVAVLAIVAGAVLYGSTQSETKVQSLSMDSGSTPSFTEEGGTGLLAKPEPKPTTGSEAATEEAEAGVSSSAGGVVRAPTAKNFDGSGPSIRASLQPKNRAVERNAELVLGADPADVADDSAEVFEAVHAHDGIVLRSSTREGEPGIAGARFELLIPSGKLGDALAALSSIDEVRTRHEATNDITAPTVTTGEMLQDSKARIDSLLAQLKDAETEYEREAVEAELRQERRHRARLRAQLQHLERRADFSRVLVRIETGASEQSSDGGAWGVGDALDDAGRILGVTAAGAVVALAILGPIALIALLAWRAHRAWLRRERRRVLS